MKTVVTITGIRPDFILMRNVFREFDKYFHHILIHTGQRYDPSLGKLIGWNEPSHVPRYQFAKHFISKQDSVIDIACGTGYGTAIISCVSKKVAGIDLSRRAIIYAKIQYKKENTKYINSDFFSIDVESDVAISFETIEHISAPSFNIVLTKLISLARNIIIGSVPYREHPGCNSHHKYFNLETNSFNFLYEFGDVCFYFQTSDGLIHAKKPKDKEIQNLIFMLKKEHEAKNEINHLNH